MVYLKLKESRQKIKKVFASEENEENQMNIYTDRKRQIYEKVVVFTYFMMFMKLSHLIYMQGNL